MANNQNTQVAIRRETVDIVAAKVKEFQNKGELFFPPNYSPENALKSAWLILQETTDKDGKHALEVCTKESIANALLSMVIQGLNPDKKQCYFIPFGRKLVMMRSYFGSMHVAKSVNENIEDIYAEVVYEGDEFEYAKQRGKTVITKHIQKLENVKKDKIIAAYACVLFKNGKEEATIMTIDEIKQAWKQSRMNPIDEKGHIKIGSTHEKFTADMCKKTVINKACKYIINSSDDRNILVKFAKETETEIVEAEVEEEIRNNANKELLDITTEYTVEDAEEEHGEAVEDKEQAPTAEDKPQKQEKPAKQEQKPQKEVKNLVEMAEEGPGY